jgi:hypothetical protein
VDHWRSEVSDLQRKNYELEVALAQMRNDKKRLQMKLRAVTKARY